MKKLSFLLIFITFLVAGCSNSSGGDGGTLEELDKDKAREAIAEGALESHILHDKGYSPSDIVNIEVCESYHIDNEEAGFIDMYKVEWETSDGKFAYDFSLTTDYEIEIISGYRKIEDRCIYID
ncbi:MAG: hypothetical protein ACQEWU_12115 [Bacillota bacterium]|uniref:Lipoprotein n=1 Tax=Virgibacillus salarius TaxID=447199 RepID=A0A941I956_9BACI|nr:MULTISPECIES: hypothetical protein [Bacillaceae]MBR7796399.1 hypothetical protein [Virgibacillus salarius]MCC2250986.1 hypothetical protein [Virgibacillus sp. AGTR]NAZ09108.1 hypothetical protein [Agaribacter marinus]WBX80591.1 hypothetical protein PD280_01625 [Virgibacillus salarius]